MSDSIQSFPLPTTAYRGSGRQKSTDSTYLAFDCIALPSYCINPPYPSPLPDYNSCPVPNTALTCEPLPFYVNDQVPSGYQYFIISQISLNPVFHLFRLFASFWPLVYNVITLGIPKRYYNRYRHNMHRSLPSTNVDFELVSRQNAIIEHFTDGWKTIVNVSCATVFTCTTALMQLFGTDESTFYRTMVIISLFFSSGSIAAGIICLGHKTSFLCRRTEDLWITEESDSYLWGTLALPAVLLSWAAVFVLVAIFKISFDMLSGGLSHILSALFIAITFVILLFTLRYAQIRISALEEPDQ